MANSNSLRRTTLGKAGGSVREYNLSRQMFSVSSSGTFVNREETSINRSQQSRVIYRANCWDCNGFYIGETKRRLHDRKTEHFKALAKDDNTPAIADHVKATGHNIKWDHFAILAKGKTDYHCKIKETLYIQELEPAFNVNVGSEKLMLY